MPNDIKISKKEEWGVRTLASTSGKSVIVEYEKHGDSSNPHAHTSDENGRHGHRDLTNEEKRVLKADEECKEDWWGSK